MSGDDKTPRSPFAQSRVFGVPLGSQHYGKCASCGFLSRNITIDSIAEHNEIGWLARDGSEPIQELRVGEVRAGLKHPDIECFLHVADLLGESNQELKSAGDFNWHEAAQRVFWKDRDCPEWFGYIPGISPQEHLKRYEMQRLEQDRRDFELRLATLTQKAEEDSKLILADSRELARDSKQLVSEITDIAKEMAVSAKASDRFARRVTFWIILLAVVQALAAIIALTKDSWIIKLLFPPAQ